jgi:hypothetical protein
MVDKYLDSTQSNISNSNKYSSSNNNNSNNINTTAFSVHP